MATGQQPFVVSAEVLQAWEHEASVRESLWSQAVTVLTQAARSTRTLAGGQVEPADALLRLLSPGRAFRLSGLSALQRDETGLLAWGP